MGLIIRDLSRPLLEKRAPIVGVLLIFCIIFWLKIVARKKEDLKEGARFILFI